MTSTYECLSQTLAEAISATLESMCFMAVVGPCTGDRGELVVGANVVFSGDAEGVLRIALSRPAARNIAASFLGVEPSDLDDQAIRTVVAEVGNMICGCMLSTRNRSGNFRLAPPIAFDPAAQPLSQSVGFELEEGVIVAEVLASATTVALA